MSYFDKALDISQIFFGGITGCYWWLFSSLFINCSIHENLGFYFRREVRDIIVISFTFGYCYLGVLLAKNIYGYLMSCYTEAYCMYYFWGFVGGFYLLTTLYSGFLIHTYLISYLPKETCFILGGFCSLTARHLKNAMFPKNMNKNKES
jgi:hypothetical protein